jgi:hypothetical protein
VEAADVFVSGWAWVAGVAVAALVALIGWRPDRADAVGWADEVPGIDAGWSFTESWLSTATLGGSAIAAVVGSTDVAATLLADATESTQENLVVTSALVAGVVAITPLIIRSSASYKRGGEAVGSPTGIGIALAAIVATAAALVELGALAAAGADLVNGPVPAVLAASVAVLVLFYLAGSMRALLGTAAPGPEVVSDELLAGLVGGLATLITGGRENEYPKLLAAAGIGDERDRVMKGAEITTPRSSARRRASGLI